MLRSYEHVNVCLEFTFVRTMKSSVQQTGDIVASSDSSVYFIHDDVNRHIRLEHAIEFC